MTVFGNRGLSLRTLIITQLLSVCRLVTNSFLKTQKQILPILLTLGCNFRVWSTILKQVKNPQSPCRCEIKIELVQEGQNAPFSHYLFIYLFIIFFFLGGGSKLFIMIATLKKIGMEQPPPHPPENKNDLRKSHNMPFIWGR